VEKKSGLYKDEQNELKKENGKDGLEETEVARSYEQ